MLAGAAAQIAAIELPALEGLAAGWFDGQHGIETVRAGDEHIVPGHADDVAGSGVREEVLRQCFRGARSGAGSCRAFRPQSNQEPGQGKRPRMRLCTVRADWFQSMRPSSLDSLAA